MARCPAKYDLYEKFGKDGGDDWCEIPVCQDTMDRMDRYLDLVRRFEDDGIPRTRTIVGLAEGAARPLISIRNHDKREKAIQHIENLLMRKTPKGGWYHDDIKGPEVIRILTRLGVYNAPSDNGDDNPLERWHEIDPNWLKACPEAVKQIEDYLGLAQRISDAGHEKVRVFELIPEVAAKPIFAIKDPVLQGRAIDAVTEFVSTGISPATGKQKPALSPTDVQAVIQKIGVGDAVEPKIDTAKELQKKWKTALGQVWEFEGVKGVHRLIIGDSTQQDTVLELFAGANPMLMVTDPPYGTSYDPHWREELKTASSTGIPRGQSACGDGALNDDCHDWTPAYSLFNGDVAYVWHGGVHADEVAKQLKALEFEIRSQIVWVKNNPVMSRSNYHWRHEPCWYVVRKGKNAHWGGARDVDTVWEIDSVRGDDRLPHGNQKPLGCMAIPIKNHDCDEVYDPFIGGGTTMIAAENLGRVCYGAELSPEFAAVTLQRWKDQFKSDPHKA